MSSAPRRTQLIVPPAAPYGALRGLAVMARNPARWWSASMYDEGVRRVRLSGRTFVHVARPELARTVLLDGRSTSSSRRCSATSRSTATPSPATSTPT